MYHNARRLVGQHVVVRHQNGVIYHGTLHSVNQQGLYLMNARGANQQISAQGKTIEVQHAIGNSEDNEQMSEAFFPFLFLPFIALAGLAAASTWYPYGYYGGYYGGGYY